jgi:hypothetical protein
MSRKKMGLTPCEMILTTICWLGMNEKNVEVQRSFMALAKVIEEDLLEKEEMYLQVLENKVREECKCKKKLFNINLN